MSLGTGPKWLHSAAILLQVYNNGMNIFPIGHWPLTGHWITKSCLTGFLLPAKRDLLGRGHLQHAELAYNRWIKSIKYAATWRQSPALWQRGWPSRVPAMPFAFCVALRWLHFCSSLCQRQTLSSCFRSVCDKRVDFEISRGRTVIRPASEVVHLTDVVIPNGSDRPLFNPVKAPCSRTWAQLPQWRPCSEPLTSCCG